jgi:hypothetical protein
MARLKKLRAFWPFNRRKGDRRMHPTGWHNEKWGYRRTGLDDRREWTL